MSWPIESDYFEAVQNPRFCFSDNELRDGTVTTTALGLPKPITGAFASVYQLNCGPRRWAVRCFLREFADQQKRYHEISAHLKRAALPFTVGFEFLNQGIKIKGQWYPILKMEWIDGETLSAYVGRNIHQPTVLTQLARQWIEMMTALRTASVAHGDLQHGNVLVSQSRLKLIDYDGMYVPTLRGRGSHEEGHRNYQHPSRTARDFDENIDNFSAWVVFLSLSAVSIEPRLWQSLNGGDESLIFRREDFTQPAQSKALRMLEQSGRSELVALATHFRSILRLPLQQVPRLDMKSTAPPPASPAPSPGPSNAVRPSWLDDHVITLPAPQPQTPSPVPQSPSPAPIPDRLFEAEAESTPGATPSAQWIIEHLVDQGPIPAPFARRSFLIDRVLVGASLLGCIGLGLLSQLPSMTGFPPVAFSVVLLVVTLVVLMIRFRSLPEVSTRDHHLGLLAAADTQLAEIEAAIEAASSEQKQIVRPLVDLDSQYRAHLDFVKTQIAASQQGLVDWNKKVQEQALDLDRRKAAELRDVDNRHANELAGLMIQRTQLDVKEQTELSQLSMTFRNRWITHTLQNSYLEHAPITGFGPRLKAKLLSAGLVTANDVDLRINQIAGIGPNKAAALMAWRQSLEQEAGLNAPAPTAQDVSNVRQRYAHTRQSLSRQINDLKGQEKNNRQIVFNKYEASRQTLDQSLRDAKIQCDAQTLALQQKGEARKVELAQQFERMRTVTAAGRTKVEADLTRLNQALTEKHFDKTKKEREADRYRNVRFRYYLGRVVGLRRSA